MRTTPRAIAIALAAVFTAAGARGASAQHAGNGYLFHAPEARITLRGGYALASARSDIFDDAVTNLTLSRRDFSGLAAGVEVGVTMADRWDISVDASYSRASKGSEFRHFIDNNNLPIEQTTLFERVPIMASIRYYLTPPGRAIGRLAWIPAHAVPWVAAGAGTMFYKFEQKGDFVDFRTSNVFPSTFTSSEWTPALQGAGGFDVSFTPTLALTTEARYIWARGSVTQDFAGSGYNKVDLSGVQATVGLTIRM